MQLVLLIALMTTVPAAKSEWHCADGFKKARFEKVWLIFTT